MVMSRGKYIRGETISETCQNGILPISEVVQAKEVKTKLQIQIPHILNPVAKPAVQGMLRDYNSGSTSIRLSFPTPRQYKKDKEFIELLMGLESEVFFTKELLVYYVIYGWFPSTPVQGKRYQREQTWISLKQNFIDIVETILVLPPQSHIFLFSSKLSTTASMFLSFGAHVHTYICTYLYT